MKFCCFLVASFSQGNLVNEFFNLNEFFSPYENVTGPNLVKNTDCTQK